MWIIKNISRRRRTCVGWGGGRRDARYNFNWVHLIGCWPLRRKEISANSLTEEHVFHQSSRTWDTQRQPASSRLSISFESWGSHRSQSASQLSSASRIWRSGNGSGTSSLHNLYTYIFHHHARHANFFNSTPTPYVSPTSVWIYVIELLRHSPLGFRFPFSASPIRISGTHSPLHPSAGSTWL